jgi:hypothetical protein
MPASRAAAGEVIGVRRRLRLAAEQPGVTALSNFRGERWLLSSAGSIKRGAELPGRMGAEDGAVREKFASLGQGKQNDVNLETLERVGRDGRHLQVLGSSD